MKALIIYDLTGKIWNIVYGTEDAPQGLPCVFVDIPEGAQADHVDLTDKEHPQVVFNTMPETDIGEIRSKLEKLIKSLATTQEAVDALILSATEGGN